MIEESVRIDRIFLSSAIAETPIEPRFPLHITLAYARFNRIFDVEQALFNI